MAELAEIRRLAEDTARRIMSATPIEDVSVQPDLGSDGDELLRVRIVIPDADAEAIDFDQFFNATLEIKQAVRNTGDDRRAMVAFITPAELAELGGPQS